MRNLGVHLASIDDGFFERAPLVVRLSIDLPHSAAQVWGAVSGDRMGSWIPVIDRAAWRSSRPFSTGARRSIRLFRAITLDEEFYRWEPPRRATFRVTDITVPVVSGWAEDLIVEPRPNGAVRLHWAMAIDNRLLRLLARLHLLRLPGRLRTSAEAAARRWLTTGISTIMEPPEPNNESPRV